MANFLSNLVGDLFSKKNGSVLGIDIGSSSIKIVQLSRKNGHAVLDTYGELALGPIEMPMVSPKQLETMIPVEARKYIPVPISEVALDWYIIPKDKNPDSEQFVDQTEKEKLQKRLFDY